MQGKEQFPGAGAPVSGGKAEKHKQSKPMKTQCSRTILLRRTLALTVIVLAAALKLQAAEYTLVDLGPGTPRHINNYNHVVGHSGLGLDKINNTGYENARVWAATGSNTWNVVDIGDNTNLVSSEARKMTDNGYIVGAGYSVNRRVGCIWTPGTNGYTLTIPDVGDENDWEIQSINTNGVYTIQDDLSDFTGSHYTGSWTSAGPIGSYNGHFTAVGLNDDEYSYPFDINNYGTVVGWAGATNNPNSEAFLWNGTNELVNLGVGACSAAFSVNSSGAAVGITGVGFTNNPSGPFVWTPNSPNGTVGTVTHLNPTNSIGGEARGINDSGKVAGFVYFDPEPCQQNWNYRAFVYDATNGVRDLNGLIPENTGWVLRYALAINNNGYIAGVGERTTYDESCPPVPTTETRAFLLIPNQ